MKNVQFFTRNGIPLSLQNLCDLHCGSTVFDIEDVVEDSDTAFELASGLNALDLFEKFSPDRETDDYVRLVSYDPWGDKHYLKAYK